MVLWRVNSDRSQNSSRHSDEQLMIKFTSQGLEQSLCLIQKRRQISSTLQPTWASLHQWRVSLHSGSRLNWFPLAIFLLTGYSAPLSFCSSIVVLQQLRHWYGGLSVFMFQICEVWTGLTNCHIRCFISESLHQHRLDVTWQTWPCSIADGFRLIAVLSHLHEPKSRWRHGPRHWCNLFEVDEIAGSSHTAAIILVTLRSPPIVFSSVTVLQWLNLSINGIHLFNGAVEHFFTQTCYFLRCWWESL